MRQSLESENVWSPEEKKRRKIFGQGRRRRAETEEEDNILESWSKQILNPKSKTHSLPNVLSLCDRKDITWLPAQYMHLYLLSCFHVLMLKAATDEGKT